jgi:very-short-patch-repair endonuclease
MAHRKVPPRQRGNAKALRRTMTDAEARLWRELRAHRLCGHGFRRQVPIGPYIVDFFCPSERLVVEVDGEQHGLPHGTTADKVRDSWLAGQGYRVLRFWNHEVLNETDAVCSEILTALGGPLAD